MKTYATYFQNDEKEPLKYDEINLINPPRQRLRGEEKKSGIEAVPVFCGFCGTDFELMKMGREKKLCPKFPEGEKRLINGHEGVVWVPSENRFAIVLIRGGDSFDPTRFTEDETYFEYGCDGADGIFCDKGYFNPDMLLHLPEKYEGTTKLPLSLAKKLVFSDPYACAVFQHERMCDIGEAQNFRVELAKEKCDEQTARIRAVESTFSRVVIFGLGTTGLFIGDQIRRNHPEANILFVARSDENSKKALFVKNELGCDYLSSGGMNEEETAKAITERIGGTASVFVGTSGTEVEHRIAFEHGVLGCNGIYNSFSLGPKVTFDTMPFGFKNQVILSSINFTQKHMETAIELLCESKFDRLVELIDKDEFTADPIDAYENKIYSKGAPLKTAVIWNPEYIGSVKLK
jgi:threonine dehydrogenase-like Zn-dependent dehydrogenase